MPIRNEPEPHFDMTSRLLYVEMMTAPRPVAPRRPTDDVLAAALRPVRAGGRMYVLGLPGGPRFRSMTWLRSIRP